MKTSLTKRQYIILGSLLFGLFFGAGNLIFPIHPRSASRWQLGTFRYRLSVNCYFITVIIDSRH